MPRSSAATNSTSLEVFPLTRGRHMAHANWQNTSACSVVSGDRRGVIAVHREAVRYGQRVSSEPGVSDLYRSGGAGDEIFPFLLIPSGLRHKMNSAMRAVPAWQRSAGARTPHSLLQGSV